MARQAVRRAKDHTDDVEFSAEDATRSDPAFLCEIVAAVLEEGATVINIPDTVGYTVPGEFAELMRTLSRGVPGLERAVLSVHCHNDLGMAVANSLAAVEAGARQVECTINGIGERAGNCSLEEVVMALRVRRDRLPFQTRIVTQEIYRTSQMLSNIIGQPVQPNKAVVGRNAFAHEAGIHQHGVLANAATYEIMTPDSVGVKTSSLVLGKHSGRHALDQRFQELGFHLEREALGKAYHLFTQLADQKKEIFDEDLVALVNDVLTDEEGPFVLRAVQATAGTHSVATALVILFDGERETTETASGDGPVNAVFEAIDRITGMPGQLLDYRLASVTGGADALGEVFLRVQFPDGVCSGKAASTDIVGSSAQAYLNAVNKVVRRTRPAAGVLKEA
jgi:2-isopropylmalate synthase